MTTKKCIIPALPLQKNTTQRLQSLQLVLHYNKNHSYVLFVHIFLDSLKSPAKFRLFQSQLSSNAGGCRPPATPRYFLIGQGVILVSFRKGHI